MKEALFYQKMPNKSVKCGLCRHFCLIRPGSKGLCGARENIDGTLFSLNYGKVIAAHIDPIEKKPLYHFLPGSKTFSIASQGCNFTCLHCQNADISQISKSNNFSGVDSIAGQIMDSDQIVQLAISHKCPSISYTYTEPTIFYEFAMDCMKKAKMAGLKNIWVSNGYTSLPALENAKEYLDAVNIDLKFWQEKNYLKICGAKLKPVLENLIWYKKSKIWLEITTLIIPGLNDSENDLKGIADFIFKELGSDTPWHISAFFPTYKMTEKEPTSKETLELAQKIGFKAGLKNVYLGNV